ncbi:hypothetical protein HDG33_006085 [Paraburkholderia sp. Cpub6]|nr:hypothetical protein [Paraburkholderia sp. Cpub6]
MLPSMGDTFIANPTAPAGKACLQNGNADEMSHLFPVARVHAYERQHHERTGQRKETEKYESL